ncbi:MAG: hypothetical protein KF850_17165 [Labilithrix sp.]|nr:hypothetical protein [Labilithrix sp.]MBX3213773.1 hypothetical protein [Labilithrix sp.]
MNKLSAVVFFGLVGLGMVAGAGCASEYDLEEESGTTESSLSRDCLKKIDAKPGTSAWRDAVKACIDDGSDDPTADDDDDAGKPQGSGKPWGDAGAGKPDPGKPESDGGAKPESGGGNVAVSCVDGVCKCAAGPNVGKACDAKTKTAANACSVLCRY